MAEREPWRLALRLSGPEEPPGRAEILAFAALALGLFVALAWGGARLDPSSAAVIAGAATEPPLYVWLVAAYAWLSGVAPPLAAAHYDALAALQTLIGLAAARWLGRSLRLAFALPRWLGALASLLLLAPYAFGGAPFGASVAAPALAYPLFMIAMSALLRGFARGDWRWLIAFIVLLPVLLLASKQLAFVVPAFALVLLWVLCAYPGPRRPKAILAGLLVAAVAAGALAERLLVQAETGRFAIAPTAGLSLIAAPLYLADDDDGALFRDRPEQRQLFRSFRREMAARNLRAQDLEQGPVPVSRRAEHYQGARGPILRRAVLPPLRQNGAADAFEIDRWTRHMAYRLMAEKPLAWLRLAFENLVHGLGGAYAAAFLTLVLALAAGIQTRRRDPLSLALATVLLFHLANLLAAALFGADVRHAAGYTAPLTGALLLTALGRAILPKPDGDA